MRVWHIPDAHAAPSEPLSFCASCWCSCSSLGALFVHIYGTVPLSRRFCILLVGSLGALLVQCDMLLCCTHARLAYLGCSRSHLGALLVHIHGAVLLSRIVRMSLVGFLRALLVQCDMVLCSTHARLAYLGCSRSHLGNLLVQSLMVPCSSLRHVLHLASQLPGCLACSL